MAKPSDNEPVFQHWKTHKLLSLKFNRAVCLLASGYETRDIAAYLGISQRTVERWLNQDEFQVSLKYAVGITLQSALANASQYANTAINTLIKISEDSTTPFKYRLEAIRLILNFAIQGLQNVKSEENIHIFEAQEQHKQLSTFNASRNLATQQRQFALPPLQSSTVVEDRKLWQQVFPDLPFPDDESLRQAYDDEH